MIRSLIYSGLSLLALTSCHHNSSSTQAHYLDDGRKKPSVALLPVIDNMAYVWPWDLSKEFTQSIQSRIIRDNILFLSHGASLRQVMQKLGPQHNPFGKDINWIKTVCPGQDFAVFLELIEHSEDPILSSPNDNPEQCATELHISLRVKVIDLRSLTPKIILQEIVHNHHHIPKPFTKYNFYQQPWNSREENPSFAISPIGLAHAQLVKEVVSRVEDYIFLNL